MGDVLSPRARRALAVMGGAAVLVAAAALYWLHGAAHPTQTGANAPLPILVIDWQFADPNHGWILVGSQTDPISRLFTTADGGAHWRALAPWGALTAFSFHFFDARRGAAQVRDEASRSGLLFTADGGSTWRRAEVPPVQFAPGELTLADPDHGYLLAGGAFYRTNDGARNWQSLAAAGLPPYSRLLGFRDGLNGWATAGALYRTRDGGQTWVADQLPSRLPADLVLLRVVSAGTAALLLTSDPPARGVRTIVYPSSDGGETWEAPRPAEPEESLPKSFPVTAFADREHWFVPGPASLWATADAGRTWLRRAVHLPADLQLGELRFTDRLDGWSLTKRFYGTPALLRSTDGGIDWTEVQLPRLG